MRNKVTEEARRLVGEPVRHSSDALNLVRHVGEACGVLQAGQEQFAAFDGVALTESVVATWLDCFLTRVEEPAEGDVCQLRLSEGQPAVHVGIRTELGGRPYLVHALPAEGRSYNTKERLAKVVEHGLLPPWRDRVVAWYRFRGA